MAKETVCIQVFDNYEYEGWRGTLPEFIGLLQEHLEGVPPEHRNAVQVEIDHDYEYGEYYFRFNARYWRDETDEEYQARLKAVEERREREASEARARELRQLAELKAKYEA